MMIISSYRRKISTFTFKEIKIVKSEKKKKLKLA